MLTACGGDVNGSQEAVDIPAVSKSAASEETPKTYKLKIQDNLNIDAKVIAPDVLPASAAEYNARVKEMDNTQYALQTIFQKSSYKKDNRTLTSQKDREGNFVSRFSYIYNTDDDSNSVMVQQKSEGQNLSISGLTPLWDKIYGSYTVDNYTAFPNKDLPFMSRKLAEEQARKFFKNMGVETGNTVISGAISHQDMQNRLDKLKNDSSEYNQLPDTKKKRIEKLGKYNDSDDCYQFRFFMEINGTPVTDFDQIGQSSAANTVTFGTKIECLYSKQGIAQFEISSVYAPIGNPLASGKPINFTQAMKLLTDKLNSVVQQVPTTVTNIAYAYAPMLTNANREDYILIPAWIFQVQPKDNNSYQLVFNALTGKELI
jgi:hypothetical protein